MMRTMLALMAGMLCMAAGLRHAAALTAEDARLRRWAEMLQHLSLILAEGACPLPEAFRQAATGQSEADRQLLALAEQMQLHPLSPLPQLWQALGDESAEAAPLRRMMQRLGRGSMESRCQAAEQAAREMALMSQQTREKSARDAKMWRTLGFLGGACITIMLL